MVLADPLEEIEQAAASGFGDFAAWSLRIQTEYERVAAAMAALQDS